MSVSAATSISYFPQVPPLVPETDFATIIQKARDNFTQYGNFNSLAAEVTPLALTWQQRNVLLINGTLDPMPTLEEQQADLKTKLDVYIKYRKVRDDSLKIVQIYDKAISQCQPPQLNPEVTEFLMILQKCRVDLNGLKISFDKVFTDDVGQLREQRSQIQELYRNIVPPLQNLCAELEVLACHVKGYNWNNPLHQFEYNALKVKEGSTTPLVKAMVREREKEIAALPEAR